MNLGLRATRWWRSSRSIERTGLLLVQPVADRRRPLAVGRVGGAVISVRTGSLAGAGGGPSVVVVAHGCRYPHPMAHFRSSVALDTTADEAFGFPDDDMNLRAIVTEVEPDDHGPGGGAAALDS